MFHRQFHNHAKASLTPNLILQCHQNSSDRESQLEQDSNRFRNYSLREFIIFSLVQWRILWTCRWTLRFLTSREFPTTYYYLTKITYQAIILVNVLIVTDITVQSVWCEIHSYWNGKKILCLNEISISIPVLTNASHWTPNSDSRTQSTSSTSTISARLNFNTLWVSAVVCFIQGWLKLSQSIPFLTPSACYKSRFTKIMLMFREISLCLQPRCKLCMCTNDLKADRKKSHCIHSACSLFK